VAQYPAHGRLDQHRGGTPPLQLVDPRGTGIARRIPQPTLTEPWCPLESAIQITPEVVY
jgi:hypothetical protein